MHKMYRTTMQLWNYHQQRYRSRSKATVDVDMSCDPDDQKHTHKSDNDERDEILEVRKGARQDTFNVRLWRFAMTGALLLTAVAVTLTIYKFLEREQQIAFETAVS